MSEISLHQIITVHQKHSDHASLSLHLRPRPSCVYPNPNISSKTIASSPPFTGLCDVISTPICAPIYQTQLNLLTFLLHFLCLLQDWTDLPWKTSLQDWTDLQIILWIVSTECTACWLLISSLVEVAVACSLQTKLMCSSQVSLTKLKKIEEICLLVIVYSIISFAPNSIVKYRSKQHKFIQIKIKER